MKRLVSALVLFTVHYLARIFFRVEAKWIGAVTDDPWHEAKRRNVRVIAFLNHTSLFEPVFAASVPPHFLWFMAGRLLVPGADKTLKRPLVGTFYKLLSPGMIPITRKRDTSWENFLQMISPRTVVMLAPEGRMKRRNGLDSRGEPMSVRGGIADILNGIPEGSLLLCYSQGLHHIQAPGEMPRLFKKAKILYELLDIVDYKKLMSTRDVPFKMAVVQDLEARIKAHCSG